MVVAGPAQACLWKSLRGHSLNSPAPAHGAQSVPQRDAGCCWLLRMVLLQRTPVSPGCVPTLGSGACTVRTRVDGACLGGLLSCLGAPPWPSRALQGADWFC